MENKNDDLDYNKIGLNFLTLFISSMPINVLSKFILILQFILQSL